MGAGLSSSLADSQNPFDKHARSQGQTKREAGRINDALSAMFAQLEERALRPSPAGTSSWSEMLRQPKLGVRKEDEDPELFAEVDAANEALSTISSAADVVSWAEENVFVRGTDAAALQVGAAQRAGFTRTYPRLLASVMAHLRSLGAPHLALAMFEHARALGIESYLAGCQTSAFNQLIQTRWEAFRDLAGVVAAVSEMEAVAVAWDRNTNHLVTAVVGQVSQDVLKSREHKWGPDAYAYIGTLERMLDEDTRREANMFKRRTEEKRALRRNVREQARYGDGGYGRERAPRRGMEDEFGRWD